MNDKIKELAEKAGFVLWGEETWNPGDAIDWSCRYDDEMTKFAELIVRECAGFAEQKYGNWYRINSPDDAPGITIKKHFGVKE